MLSPQPRARGAIAQLAGATFLAIDTEFMRGDLLLAALPDRVGDGTAAAIDPLAPGSNLRPCGTFWPTPPSPRCSTPHIRIWRSSSRKWDNFPCRCSTRRSQRWFWDMAIRSDMTGLCALCCP